ncbi:MAG TPA: hypothetical protein DCM71_05255 [Runella sp.]|nr:hypothetical protein [Runella sp.]
MATFKNAIINCQKCGKLIIVKSRDFEKGTIQCAHQNCGYVNKLTLEFYDDRILQGLPLFGQLVYVENPSLSYPLQMGVNTIGHSSSCTVHTERFIHDGKCYLSRRHCTIEVFFDQWTGLLRYILQDGALETESGQFKYSLNGTSIGSYFLKNGEKLDVPNKGLINLGGRDIFRLEVYEIPTAMLQSYKVSKLFDPDETQ